MTRFLAKCHFSIRNTLRQAQLRLQAEKWREREGEREEKRGTEALIARRPEPFPLTSPCSLWVNWGALTRQKLLAAAKSRAGWRAVSCLLNILRADGISSPASWRVTALYIANVSGTPRPSGSPGGESQVFSGLPEGHAQALPAPSPALGVGSQRPARCSQ